MFLGMAVISSSAVVREFAYSEQILRNSGGTGKPENSLFLADLRGTILSL